MAAFLYRCPTVGMRVQGWVADDPSADDNTYESMTCIACRQVHLVKPSTGKVLGANDDE
jgi:hypothetical protein